MSEGARYGRTAATLRLRPSDQRGPGRTPAAGPERADEGGGPTPGRLTEGRLPSVTRFCEPLQLARYIWMPGRPYGDTVATSTVTRKAIAIAARITTPV